MNKREKSLAMVIGGIVVAGGLFFVGRHLLLKPLRDLDAQTGVLSGKLQTIKGERRAYFEAEDALKRLTQRTFSDEIDQASAKSGATLTSQILTSGLQEADFSRLPVGPRKLKGALEIGWSVQGDGALDQIINLLFLLEKSPHLHRIDGLTLSPGDKPTKVKVLFRYLTLVIDPAPMVEPVELKHIVGLDSAERALYTGIIRRDILRPFVPPPAVAVKATSPATASPPGPGPETFQIVSLSEWKGQQEVHVRDLTLGKTLLYRTGDELAGGKVVMIDYRALPKPGRLQLTSNSRVILRIGPEFWAIERGQTLAQKYRLAPEQLPEQLSRL